MSNSAVLQIGSAGIIKNSSYNYNTGGFVGPAPELTAPESPLIPLPPPIENLYETI